MDRNYQEQVSNKSDEINLKDVFLKLKSGWHYLLTKWLVILTMAVIGGIIGLVYAWRSKTVYKAELSFYVQDEKSNGALNGALGLASQFGFNVGGADGGEFAGDNLLALMKSRSIMEKALLSGVNVNNRQETFAEFYIDINNIRKSWEKIPRLKAVHFPLNTDRKTLTQTQDSILGVIHDQLVKKDVILDKLDKKSSITSLSVTSKNELFAKSFAEVLTKVISDFYIQTKTKKAMQNVAVLQKQTDSVRLALNSAISGVASYSDAVPNANPSFQSLHVPSQRKQVDVQANTAILSELVKNLEVAKMSLLQQTPLIEVIDHPILPLPKSRPGKLITMIEGCFVAVILTIIFLFLKRVFTNLNS